MADMNIKNDTEPYIGVILCIICLGYIVSTLSVYVPIDCTYIRESR